MIIVVKLDSVYIAVNAGFSRGMQVYANLHCTGLDAELDLRLEQDAKINN